MIGFCLAVALVAIGLGWFWPNRRQAIGVSREHLQVLSQALYQSGYNDQKAGRPERSWEWDGPGKLNDSHKALLEAFKRCYLQGRQDCLAGKPSIAEEIAEIREKQIRVLGEMKEILDGFRNRDKSGKVQEPPQ